MITNGREWHARWTSTLPIQAVLATAFAMVLSWGTVLVLSLSDGKPLGSWFISPSVCLAILSTSTNALLRFVFSEGVVISWWSLALRGASINDLHRTWTFSDSFFAALTSASPVSTLLRVASLIVTLLVVDGPLLQKASTLGQLDQVNSSNMTLPIRTYPLWNQTIRAFSDARTYFQPEFNEVMGEYISRKDITLPSGICNGSCTATVTIGGFDRNCTSSRQDMRTVPPSVPFNGAMVQIGWREGKNDYNKTLMPIFQMESAVVNQDYIQLFSVLRDSGIGSDVLVRTCLLKPALINLDLDIANTTVSFRRIPLTENRTVEMTRLDKSYTYQVLEGFSQVLRDQYDSAVGKNSEDGLDTTGPEYFSGRTSFTYLNQTDLDQYVKIADPGGFTTFNRTWIDPLPDYFSSLDELSLRYAMKVVPQTPDRLQEYTIGLKHPAGPDLPKLATPISIGNEQRVAALQTTSVVVYRTNKTYLSIALTVMLLATSSIASTLFGWWHLGRKFTFSPVEIAKAFDAQLLAAAGSNMRAKELLTIMGDRKVRYGVLRKELSMSYGAYTAAEAAALDRFLATNAVALGDETSEHCSRLLMLRRSDAEEPIKGEIYC